LKNSDFLFNIFYLLALNNAAVAPYPPPYNPLFYLISF